MTPSPVVTTDAELRRVSAIRMTLIEAHPFWGYLLMQCRIIPARGLGAIAATDCRKNIYFDPYQTAKLRIMELGFVLLHEVCHHVQASFERQNGRDQFLWNCATDFAINRIIADIPDSSGLSRHIYSPPSGILLDRSMDGMVAEAIYEQLLGNKDFRDRRKSVVRVTISLPSKDSQDSESGEAPKSGKPKAGAGIRGKPTSGGTGGAGCREITVEDHGGGIDVHLPGDLADSEREALEDMVRAAVGHWRASDKRGSIPSNIARKYDAAIPRVNWRRQLLNHLSAFMGRNEFSRSRPNRRWMSEGVIVPGCHDEKVGRVVVALDTSGSMSPELLGEVIAEIKPLMEQVLDLDLVVADAKVPEVVSLDELPTWFERGEAAGGGGTSHVPVFDWVARNGNPPDLFIGLTDLHTVLPPRRPNYPVLWVVPEGHGEAKWGTVVVAS